MDGYRGDGLGRWKGVRLLLILLRIPPYLTMRDLHGRKHYSALDWNGNEMATIMYQSNQLSPLI